MIYLQLFLTFLEIGAVSFGGGYSMIPLIRELSVANGWLTEGELLNFIAVSESTPGPIAINMATFVGSSQGGLFGAFCATLGVVLPSFVIILLLVAILKNLMKKPAVQGALGGVRPCVVGLILAAGMTLLLSSLFGFSKVGDAFSPDPKALLIFALVAAIGITYKKVKKKTISPILLIVVSALLGGVLYSL